MSKISRQKLIHLAFSLAFFVFGVIGGYLLFGLPTEPNQEGFAGIGKNQFGGVQGDIPPNTNSTYSGIPLFRVVSVERGESVTIQTFNFPANMSFNATMGKMYTRGVGGFVVGSLNSDNGGILTATFSIPDSFKDDDRISIRLQTNHAYPFYAFNWFYNTDWSLTTTEIEDTQSYIRSLGPSIKYEWPNVIYNDAGGIYISFLNIDKSRLFLVPTINAENSGTRVATSNLSSSTIGTPESSLISAFGPNYEPFFTVLLRSEGGKFDFGNTETDLNKINERVRFSIDPDDQEQFDDSDNIWLDVTLHWIPIDDDLGLNEQSELVLQTELPVTVKKSSWPMFAGINIFGWGLGIVATIVGNLATTFISKRMSSRKNNIESAAVLTQLQNSSFLEMKLLHKILDDHFSEQELRTLCFQLGVDYDDLPSSGQSNKARELVSLFTRNKKLNDLHEAVKEARPKLFEDASEPAQQ